MGVEDHGFFRVGYDAKGKVAAVWGEGRITLERLEEGRWALILDEKDTALKALFGVQDGDTVAFQVTSDDRIEVQPGGPTAVIRTAGSAPWETPPPFQ